MATATLMSSRAPEITSFTLQPAASGLAQESRPERLGLGTTDVHAEEFRFAPSGVTPRGFGSLAGKEQSLLWDQAQRGMPSLWLGCWRGKDDSSFKQKLARLLPDKIADPGGGDIACKQLDGMRPRPFSPLVGALTTRPTAVGWRPAAGTDLTALLV